MQVDMQFEKWRSERGKLVTYCILCQAELTHSRGLPEPPSAEE